MANVFTVLKHVAIDEVAIENLFTAKTNPVFCRMVRPGKQKKGCENLIRMYSWLETECQNPIFLIPSKDSREEHLDILLPRSCKFII